MSSSARYRDAAGSPTLEALEIELGLDGSSEHAPALAGRGPLSHEDDGEPDPRATSSFRGGPSLLAANRGHGRRRWCCGWRVALKAVAAGGFVLLLVSLLSCLARKEPVQRSVAGVCSANTTRSGAVRNVIFMIPDGMGPAYLNLTRAALLAMGKPGVELALDGIEYGRIRTRSRSDNITDSAAAATAYATGERTDNLHLSIRDGEPIPTVLEGAEAAGMWTGLVTTARVTHATPAGFSAHVKDRDEENDIALQQLEQGIEVLLGGGRRHFLPKSAQGSRRGDGRNMEQYAQKLSLHRWY
eukprot:jgi/Tetstr1/460654/TSEL_005850.t1